MMSGQFHASAALPIWKKSSINVGKDVGFA
jgi:hypothetical protein